MPQRARWSPPAVDGAIWRIGAGAGTVILVAVVAFVVGPAVAATNVPRPEIGATPASKGLDYESVTVTTDDGVRLAGWYLPSTNRAAVVLLHGAGSTRSNVLDEAAVLARHGFGVLMIDARGHGDSGGRAMDFGWHGDADIAAATGYLAERPDVDPQRIGVVGMSMGGEEAIGAAATNPLIGAVVAEGATARNAADEAWLSNQFGVRGLLQEQIERLQDMATDVLTDASVPTSMRDAVATSGDTRYLLITAGNVADEGHAADLHRRRSARPGADLDRPGWRPHRRPRHRARGMGTPRHRLPQRAPRRSDRDVDMNTAGRSQSSTHWRAQRGRGSRRWFGPAEAVPTWCDR